MFERSAKLHNAHPVVERFLPVNLREAVLSTEKRAALDPERNDGSYNLCGRLADSIASPCRRARLMTGYLAESDRDLAFARGTGLASLALREYTRP